MSMIIHLNLLSVTLWGRRERERERERKRERGRERERERENKVFSKGESMELGIDRINNSL